MDRREMEVFNYVNNFKSDIVRSYVTADYSRDANSGLWNFNDFVPDFNKEEKNWDGFSGHILFLVLKALGKGKGGTYPCFQGYDEFMHGLHPAVRSKYKKLYKLLYVTKNGVHLTYASTPDQLYRRSVCYIDRVEKEVIEFLHFAEAVAVESV